MLLNPMPRPTLPLHPNRLYHIYAHANGDENLFRQMVNYHYFLQLYAQHVHPVVKTYAYCLLPNHVHFMVRVREVEVLKAFGLRKGKTLQGAEALRGLSKLVSRQFSHLFNAYTQAYNRRFGRRGSLFEPNFRRKSVDHEAYADRLMVYIHMNAVHHRLVSSVDAWPHSSWHAYQWEAMQKRKSALAREEGWGWFGSHEVFQGRHRELGAIDMEEEWT